MHFTDTADCSCDLHFDILGLRLLFCFFSLSNALAASFAAALRAGGSDVVGKLDERETDRAVVVVHWKQGRRMSSVNGGDMAWVGKRPARRLGGMADVLTMAADLGFAVPVPISKPCVSFLKFSLLLLGALGSDVDLITHCS